MRTKDNCLTLFSPPVTATIYTNMYFSRKDARHSRLCTLDSEIPLRIFCAAKHFCTLSSGIMRSLIDAWKCEKNRRGTSHWLSFPFFRSINGMLETSSNGDCSFLTLAPSLPLYSPPSILDAPCRFDLEVGQLRIKDSAGRFAPEETDRSEERERRRTRESSFQSKSTRIVQWVEPPSRPAYEIIKDYSCSNERIADAQN